MTAYYNEHDPKAAEWLRTLILMGEIAEGIVDERSIEDVAPRDLDGFTQCHFFAGIGGWSHALRLSGIPDNTPVWTGSCPCQPFSQAGKGDGFADERHLWPAFLHLIRLCRPQLIFGEQVARNLAWLDLVQTDLEGEAYAVGSAIIGAHSVGAPHIRQRIYWMADAGSERRQQISRSASGDEGAHGRQSDGDNIAPGNGEIHQLEHTASDGREQRRPESSGRGTVGGCSSGELGDAERPGCERITRGSVSREGHCDGACADSTSLASGYGIVPDTDGGHASAERQQRSGQYGLQPQVRGDSQLADADSQRLQERSEQHSESRSLDMGQVATFWDDAGRCGPDAKGLFRPIEPGLVPLVDGLPGRVGLLRGYGNAIVPQTAEAFIRAYLSL